MGAVSHSRGGQRGAPPSPCPCPTLPRPPLSPTLPCPTLTPTLPCPGLPCPQGPLVGSGHKMAQRKCHVIEVARLERGDILNGITLLGKMPIFSVEASTDVSCCSGGQVSTGVSRGSSRQVGIHGCQVQ